MEFDWSVGEILKALDRLGMRENTVVLFKSASGWHRGRSELVGNSIYRGILLPQHYIFRNTLSKILLL